LQLKAVWDDLPDKEVIQKNIDEFFRFMYERHQIYVRRNILKMPPPWTTDLVLRDNHFTNVYRELDAGTVWYLEHAPETKGIELLWWTIIYRLINRVKTFEKVQIPRYHHLTKHLKNDWFKDLEKLHETESIFTSAHITLPVGTGRNISRLEKLREIVDYLEEELESIHDELKKVRNLKEAFNILRRIPCVGPFIAYEIMCDLMYRKYLPFTENDWVNPGPGCKLGIRLMFPRTKGDKRFQDRIEYLKDTQRIHFQRLGLIFPFLYPNRPLTLRSIEHSLCEYSKYFRLKHSTAGKKRRFKPRDWPNASGQLPFRFPREK
jgi:hypothetical protein